MTCAKCGARCQGRFCRECELEQRYSDGTTGGTADSEQPDTITYRCTQCGCKHEGEGLGACPDCGSHRHRAIEGASA